MSEFEGGGEVVEASEGFDSTESEGDEASQEIEESEGDESSEVEGEEVEGEEEVEEKEDSGEVDLNQLFKVEINGESFEVSQEELITNYQLKKASYDKFQEAAKIKSSVEQFVHNLRDNPIEGLKTLGYDGEDLKELIYTTARSMLEEDGLPEEERARRTEKQELERLRKEKEELEKQQNESKMAQAQQQAMVEYNKAFTKALESNSVPATPAAIRRMAQIMHTSLSSGYDMTVDEAAAYYREEQSEIIKSQLGGLSGEELKKVLGKEQADKLRKDNISKLKNPKAKSKNPPNKSSSSKAAPKQSMAEFLKGLKG